MRLIYAIQRSQILLSWQCGGSWRPESGLEQLADLNQGVSFYFAAESG